jgi:hypothetical protein
MNPQGIHETGPALRKANRENLRGSANHLCRAQPRDDMRGAKSAHAIAALQMLSAVQFFNLIVRGTVAV